MKNAKNSQGANSFYPRIKDYTRILRQRGSMYGGDVTVYGSDKDLAIVVGDGFTEKVAFIEMKNIRAVLIRRFPLKLRALVMGLLFLFVFGLLYNYSKEEPGLMLFLFLLLALFYGIFLFALKTCSVRIVTEVNEHPIMNVHRLRVAKKLLHFVTARMQPYLSMEASAEAEPVPPPPLDLTPERTPEPEMEIP